MAAFMVTIKRVNSGTTISTGAITANLADDTEINKMIARNPDNITVIMDVVTEAQIRSIVHYCHAVATATDVSSADTEIGYIF